MINSSTLKRQVTNTYYYTAKCFVRSLRDAEGSWERLHAPVASRPPLDGKYSVTCRTYLRDHTLRSAVRTQTFRLVFAELKGAS